VTSIENARTASSGVGYPAMPASWKILRASATAASPSQQPSTRGGAPGGGTASGTSARAISALGTIAVGACTNSTAPPAGSSPIARSAST
jgi:hypothetical protein